MLFIAYIFPKKDDSMNIKKKLSESLEIPEDIISNTPKITLTGKNLLKAENYRSLVEYETDVIRINTSEALIRIDGSALNINSVTDEIIEISGEIEKIIFE